MTEVAVGAVGAYVVRQSNNFASLPKNSSRNSLTKIEKTNLERLSPKVAQKHAVWSNCR